MTATSPDENPQFARARDPVMKLTDMLQMIKNKNWPFLYEATKA
jgi:hypothetical protein